MRNEIQDIDKGRTPTVPPTSIIGNIGIPHPEAERLYGEFLKDTNSETPSPPHKRSDI